MYSVSNSISGIIMIIMIISFRTKTNMDYSEETDTNKKEDDAHPLSKFPSSWEGLGVGFYFTPVFFPF